MNAFIWIEARTPEQAVAELARARADLGSAVIKAGGVDLLDRMKEGLERPARLVNLRRATGHGMGEITQVQPAGGPAHLSIGALVTLRQVAEEARVRQHLPALAEAAAQVATPQIRQVATLGGNLLQRPRCWYLRSALHPCKKKGGTVCFAQEGENDLHAVFDNTVCAAVHPSGTATALVALEAQAVILGEEGVRRLPLDELFLSPGTPGVNLQRDHRLGPAEVLLAVEVPLPAPGARNVYLKVRHKQSFDWPLCEVAVATVPGARPSARIVVGAVAPVPYRARAGETALQALPKVDDAGLRRVAEAALRGARPLAQNGYKLRLMTALIERALRLVLT